MAGRSDDVAPRAPRQRRSPAAAAKPPGQARARKANVSNAVADAAVPASQQGYLAAELGQPVDHEGEPLGLDFPLLRRDREWREFTLSLWRQFQATRTLNAQTRELEQEGLAAADLWEPGITEFLPTSSTPEQMRRYKQKLLFRANFLEAALTETVAELKKLDHAKPLAPEPDATEAPPRTDQNGGQRRLAPAADRPRRRPAGLS